MLTSWLLFPPSFCFLMEMTSTQNPPWFVDCSQVCPKAEESTDRTKLLWQICICPFVEEEVCNSRHTRLRSPPFLFSVTAKGGKFVLSLSLTSKLNGCKIRWSIILYSCSCRNIIHVFISLSLKVHHLPFRNLFPAAL